MIESKYQEQQPSPRMATLAVLRETLLALYFDPVPHPDTLRRWFDDGKVPRIKSNFQAARGGGPVYYSVAGVEKYIRSRTLTM